MINPSEHPQKEQQSDSRMPHHRWTVLKAFGFVTLIGIVGTILYQFWG